MQIHVELIAVAVILVASTESKPAGYDLRLSNYQDYKEPAETISLQPQVLQYQEALSPYYVYNVQTDLSPVPPAVIATEKTTISHFPSYSLYYGTPVINVHIPLPLVPHEKIPEVEVKGKAVPPTTTTMKPSEEAEGSLEKLDAKAVPEMEKKDPCLNRDKPENDSITVDAI